MRNSFLHLSFFKRTSWFRSIFRSYQRGFLLHFRIRTGGLNRSWRVLTHCGTLLTESHPPVCGQCERLLIVSSPSDP